MKNKISISIILLTILFTLTGCYDASSIEDSYYIVGMGIDLAENDLYNISIQIAKNKGGSSSESSGSSQSSEYTIYSVQAETIESGLTILNNYLNKKLNLSHCSVFILSEDLAKKRCWSVSK